ncbi:MAG: carbohydrate kinase [Firmicutes bacterium]|nr:carbohydrate kinase [Bacillota bacterium]
MFKLTKSIEIENENIDVITIGEVIIDMISKGYSTGFENKMFFKYFGGSPGNIAINLRQLGLKSAVITNLGNDGFGKFLIDSLMDFNVNVEGVTLDNKYNTSLVVVSKSKKNPSFIAYRQADKELKLTNNLTDLIDNAKIVHFTSWAISHEPIRTTTMALLDKAKSKGKLIGFDPNYREILWQKDHNGLKFIKEIIKKVDIIKPSLDDSKNILGEDSIDGYIDKYLNLGAKLVILTLGEDGAIIANENNRKKISAIETSVNDTTGAGDALWSGFYAGVLKGETIEKSVEIGSAVSALKLKETGAITKIPRLSKVKKIFSL